MLKWDPYNHFLFLEFETLELGKKRLSFIPKHRKLNVHLKFYNWMKILLFLKAGFLAATRKKGTVEQWNNGF